jgi:DNA-binding NarL/FixJ family response regulator
LKNVRGDELISAIRRVAQGEMLLSDEQIARARERLRRQITEDMRLESLSAQERRILELLSEGLSNREIAAEMFLAEKTVKNYVSNLLAKLGFQRRTEAALFAQRQHDRAHPFD